jgi:uncharacterized membrane protein YgcG
MRTCALSLCLGAFAALASPGPTGLRPPPKGHWARDFTGKVSASTLGKLDAIAESVDASGDGQLGICVTDSTNGQVPRTFATTVFNAWGVGHAGRDDGILLFVALSDRKAEIVLGSNTSVTSSQTDLVMANEVVANFKRGQVDEGLLAAAQALAGLMSDASARSAPAPTRGVDEVLMAYVRHERAFPEHSPRTWVVDLSNVLTASKRAALDGVANEVYADSKGRVFFLVVDIKGDAPSLETLAKQLQAQVQPVSKLPLGIVAWDQASSGLLLLTPPGVVDSKYAFDIVQARQADLADRIFASPSEGLAQAGRAVSELLTRGVPPRPTTEVLRQGLEEHQAPVLGALGLGFFGGFLGLRRWSRRRPRTCEHCHAPRERLDEQADDAHLASGQVSEERLGSVDYDVWWCGRCSDALVIDYSAWFSSYSRCPQCSNRTRSRSSTTLQWATEHCGGLVQVDERCASCSYTNRYTRTTARLTRSHSSSSSSSSFGGGRSSGGGSSGSW